MCSSCGVSYTDDALDIVPALNRAELALRIRATHTTDGLERGHLNALADVVAAELRIQQRRETTEADAARRRPRRKRRPVPPEIAARIASTEPTAA